MEIQVCSTADYGDYSKGTQAGLKYVGAVAEILSDEKVLDTVGKYAGMLSKFAGAAGPALALVDVIISMNAGDPKHDAIMREFGKVLNAVDGVEHSLRHQTSVIMEGQARESLFEILRDIKANSKNLQAHLKGGSSTIKNYVIEMYKDSDFSKSINTALIHLNGPNSLPDRLYERSYGSIKEISRLSVQMQSLLVEAIMNYQYACRLSGKDKNVCAKDSAVLFQDGLTKLDRKFTSVINRCKDTNSLKANIYKRIEQDPEIRNRKNYGPKDFMFYLLSVIESHYSFLDASIIVFDKNCKPWSWNGIGHILIRKDDYYGKNILIIARHKMWDPSKSLSQIQTSIRYTAYQDYIKFHENYWNYWRHGSSQQIFDWLKPYPADYITIRGCGRYIGHTRTTRFANSGRALALGMPHHLFVVSVFKNEICRGELCDRFPGISPLTGNEVDVIPNWGPQFHIKFNLMILDWKRSGWSNVLRFTSINDRCCSPGGRIPALFVHSSGGTEGYLHHTMKIDDDGNSAYDQRSIRLRTWYNIEYKQFLDPTNKWRFEIRVDGRTIHKKILRREPTTFNNVKVYLSDDYYGSAHAKVKDLTYTSDGASKSKWVADGECYLDSNARILPYYVRADYKGMTTSLCKKLCFEDNNFVYAGVQFSGQCFCGDNRPDFKARSELSGCNMKCPGDSSTYCGASWKMNVYGRYGTSNVELIGGKRSNEGNVLVGGKPVCDDLWDPSDAKVVCKMLGFSPTSAHATSLSKFGQVEESFIMDNVQCQGTESSLDSCKHLDKHNCRSHEGAGVICGSRSCEPGWTYLYHTKKCYRYFANQISWPSALKFCKEIIYDGSSTLASSRDSATNNFLDRLTSQRSWIGGFLQSNKWKWTDGSSNTGYTKWNTGEPNNAHGKELYLERLPGSSGVWNDAPLSHKTGLICQYNLY